MTKIYHTNAKELYNWLRNNEAILIDVREKIEHKSESIKDARNLPLSDISISKDLLNQYKNKKIVIHCKSGRRSMMACEKLKNNNAPFDIWNLKGGIESWKEDGFKVEALTKKIIPLERQVNLVSGSMILIGVVITYFVTNYGLLLPLIAGMGLINNGLTGWCGMIKLLKNMPWNK